MKADVTGGGNQTLSGGGEAVRSDPFLFMKNESVVGSCSGCIVLGNTLRGVARSSGVHEDCYVRLDVRRGLLLTQDAGRKRILNGPQLSPLLRHWLGYVERL